MVFAGVVEIEVVMEALLLYSGFKRWSDTLDNIKQELCGMARVMLPIRSPQAVDEYIDDQFAVCGCFGRMRINPLDQFRRVCPNCTAGLENAVHGCVLEVWILEEVAGLVDSLPTIPFIAANPNAVFQSHVIFLGCKYGAGVEPLGPDVESFVVDLRHLNNTILAFLPVLFQRSVEKDRVGTQEGFMNVILLLRCADTDQDGL